jgi:hypothetical protein
VHHLKRGKILRETLPLTSLVEEVSQLSLKSYTSGERKDLGQPYGCHGALGQPDIPKGQRLGSRTERKGEGEHATCLVPLESAMLNTGSSSQDGKGSGP